VSASATSLLDDQSVARQPELRGELQGIQWLGFALTEAVVFYACSARFWRTCSSDAPRTNPADPGHAGPDDLDESSGFLIALFVLKRYAFGPIQKLIDERRERIRRALDEARPRPARKRASCSRATAS